MRQTHDHFKIHVMSVSHPCLSRFKPNVIKNFNVYRDPLFLILISKNGENYIKFFLDLNTLFT